MKRISIILSTMLCMALVSCSPTNETYKFLDEEHKSFYINGVSAVNGHKAVINSLENIGFQMGEIHEVNLSIFGQGITYYTILTSTRPFTRDEFDLLTNGLFVDLPSGDAILHEVNNFGCRVYLSWYGSGVVEKATIQISRTFIEPDAIEVNKRLASLFPFSRIGNSASGYLIYYTDCGVEVFYTNDYFISIEKKLKKSK